MPKRRQKNFALGGLGLAVSEGESESTERRSAWTVFVGCDRQRACVMEIAAVALVVRDYDEAIAYFVDRLGFTVVEDTPVGGGKRWVVVRPTGGGTALLLAKAATAEQETRVGDQTGGRVFLFLRTDDFWRDYRALQSRGVRFAEQPRAEAYGTVAVFLDLYGNRWDLIQLGQAGPGVALDQGGR